MQKTTYKLDNGANFGSGDDSVSEYIYRTSAPYFLKNVETENKNVADYGGANGILEIYLNAGKYTVIDIDESKRVSKNFIADDIVTHTQKYDLVICRYVLHYLSESRALQLFKQIRQNQSFKVLVIQFTNEKKDLELKRQISAKYETGSEQKHFRNCKQLFQLFEGFEIENVDKIDYLVREDFYQNRFGTNDAFEKHREQIYSVLLSPKI